MSEHTPPPWFLQTIAGPRTIVTSERQAIALMASYNAEDAEESDANARLIIAAPDLKDSTINLVSYVRSLGHPDDPTVRALLDMANAALTKAKGG